MKILAKKNAVLESKARSVKSHSGTRVSSRGACKVSRMEQRTEDGFGIGAGREGDIRIREAEKNDCVDMLYWRNHPDVRRHSFSNEEIGDAEHGKWFFEKIHDKNTKIYIAEVKELGKIGQIRFNILNDRVAYVNVNLNPIFIGRGFGSKVIAKGTKLFLKENSVMKIIAEILIENTASKKAFHKAGYTFSHNMLKSGRKCSVYKFEN